ncbi:unnamed protein product [Amoebophrya sp. A25]|nr:unnamed protein product [Amoebophrya sp. A25]|eukprot:GSA25T00007237001.1
MLHRMGPPHVFITSLDLFAEEESVVTMLYSSCSSTSAALTPSGSPAGLADQQPDHELQRSPTDSTTSSRLDGRNVKYMLKLPLVEFANGRQSRASSSESSCSGASSSSSQKDEGERPSQRPTNTGFTGTGDLTAALLLARTFEHCCDLPRALELVGASLQAVLNETALSGKSRSYIVNAAPQGGTRTNATDSTASANGNHPTAPDSPLPKIKTKKEVKVVPPEIRLVQSKASLERPNVLYSSQMLEYLADEARTVPSLNLKAVVFDMDGTLTLPHQIDFAAMRAAVGAPKGKDIVSWINAIESEEERKAAHEKIRKLEMEADYNLQPDAIDVLSYLKRRGYKLGLVTRNFPGGVGRFLDTVKKEINDISTLFDGIRTREDVNIAPKPSGDAIIDLCKTVFHCDPRDVLMIGDHLDDILCGQNAGAYSCELFEQRPHFQAKPDIRLSSLSGLKRFL